MAGQVVYCIPQCVACHFGRASKAPKQMANQGILPTRQANCGVLQSVAQMAKQGIPPTGPANCHVPQLDTTLVVCCKQGILPKQLANCRVPLGAACLVVRHKPPCMAYQYSKASKMPQSMVKHKQGILPTLLANFRACQWAARQGGQSSEVPWRVKEEEDLLNGKLFQANKAGQVIDKRKLIGPGLVRQIKGWLTVQRCHAAAIVVDHDSLQGILPKRWANCGIVQCRAYHVATIVDRDNRQGNLPKRLAKCRVCQRAACHVAAIVVNYVNPNS
jgi:hypothetical protein